MIVHRNDTRKGAALSSDVSRTASRMCPILHNVETMKICLGKEWQKKVQIGPDNYIVLAGLSSTFVIFSLRCFFGMDIGPAYHDFPIGIISR